MSQYKQFHNRQSAMSDDEVKKYLCMNSLAQKIITATKKHLRDKLQFHNITYNQWQILRTLYANEVKMPSQIAIQAGLDSPSITRILDELEIRGIIARERQKRDRRAITISLTPKGKSITEKVITSLDDYGETFESSLTDVELNVWKYIDACLVDFKN